MPHDIHRLSSPDAMARRTDELFREHQQSIYVRTDRWFAMLMALQWLGGIFAALVISPRTWIGAQSQVHIHVWAAIFLGGILSAFPIALTLSRPGWASTRHVVAVGQMLWSALLIHLTGGRIETHFHVFGSLAFLAFYRDWRGLITATVVVALDHLMRGVYYPQSVYGILTASPWRWLEHAWWVLFEDAFLVAYCIRGVAEMRSIAQRTTQLEAANKELEGFTYSVSHDLRAPLRHVAGFVGLLQQESAASLDAKGRRRLKAISESADRMGVLIDDLLAFARVGRSGMQKSAVNLNQLVQETLDELQPVTKGREIAWKIDPLPAVQADREMMRQILVNLISNAVKFTRTRPRAEIEIGSLPNGEDDAVIFIRDNGVGFDPQYVDKLFGVFQRLHSSDEFEGTGIGLANVRRVVQRHGGKAWAEGAVDGGATFYFSIQKTNGGSNGR